METIFFICFLAGLFIWGFRRRRGQRVELPQDGLLRRELGNTIEDSLHTFHLVGGLHLANVIFITSKESLNESTVRAALDRIGRRHVFMRSRIVERRRNLPAYFEEINDFETPYSVSQSTDWVSEYETILNRQYEETEPLWTVAYLPNVPSAHSSDEYKHQYTLIFGFRHENIDGTSYIKIFEELLDDIENVHRGDTDQEVKSNQMPVAIENVLASYLKPTKGAAFLSGVIELIIQLPFIKYLFSASRLPSNPWIDKYGAEIERNSSVEEKTCFLPTCLSEKETAALFSLCKKNKVTVQAAIQTASVVAMTQLMNDGEVPEVHQEDVCVTVNMRRFFPETFEDHNHQAAAYFSPLNLRTRVTTEWTTDFWKLADENGQLLKRNLGMEAVNFLKTFRILGVLNKAGLNVVDLLKKSFGRFENNLAFTNLGNCNHLSNRKTLVKIVARYGSSSEHVVGPIFANNIMTVSNKLYWTITFYQNITRKSTALKYANTVREVMETILD